jgi:hypothetical protein
LTVIDFPQNPTVGEEFTDPTSGATWTWDGVKWTASGLSGSGYVLPPASTTVLGGVKVDGASIAAAVDGTISTPGGPFLPLAGGTTSGRVNVGSGGAAGQIRLYPSLIEADAPAGYGLQFNTTVGGVSRWNLYMGDLSAETGGNAGCNFRLTAYSDTGVGLSNPISINRATGLVTIPNLNPPPLGDNRIINGDMRVDQRNSGAAGNPVTGGYWLDRWRFGCSQAAKLQCGRQSTPGGALAQQGFPYFQANITIAAVTLAAADFFYVAQPIEADMVSDFAWGTANAQPVTLSFWVNSSLTGTFSGCLQNAANTRSYPFTFAIAGAFIWTKISVTIPGDTAGTWVMNGNAAALLVMFNLGTGATYSGPAGAWATANYVGANGAVSIVSTLNAQFNLSGVKLEIGTVATPYNRPTMAKALADCQRYFYKPIGTIWGGGFNSVAAGSSCFATRAFPTTMRAAPTQSGATFSATNCAAPVLGTLQADGAVWSSVNTAAGGFQFSANAGTETYSAEL